jgi:hypothetical protein
MKTQKGLTLIELLVMIAVLLTSIFIFDTVFHSHHGHPSRIVCSTNLRGLGTAMYIYAHDYNGSYPQLPGTGPWSKELGFSYDLEKPDFSPQGAQGNTPRTHALLLQAGIFLYKRVMFHLNHLSVQEVNRIHLTAKIRIIWI